MWGIPSSTFHDGMKELREKGFIEDGIVHQQSIYEESEIRKTKRKSNDSEIRICSHTEFGEDPSEIQYSNKIRNNINNNNETLSASPESFRKKPEEKYPEEFVF